MAIPHGVGSVWAQVAWEMYWALVDTHGFDADLMNGGGGAGNQRAMLYVNEGLMNTSCSPAFTDVRDGIIQAATDNHGGDDVCLLWSTFAGIGLGTDAVSGGANGTSPTNGSGVPGACLANAPKISVNDVSIPEGNSLTNATGGFEVTLSASSSSTVAVDYATAEDTASASSLSNATLISIPSSGSTPGAATPYPSTITVPSSPAPITNVTVTLDQFSHSWPDDVDVLLVGPGGQTTMLMSDVGGQVDASGLTLTFDDAEAPLPDTSSFGSGTYGPTNLSTSDSGSGVDVFPGPAPVAPYGTALSVFNGTDPTGTWSLYVADDFGGADGGTISGGWSLTIVPDTFGDYTSASGTLTYSPGTVSQTVNVVVLGDTTVEVNETFFMNLSNAVNATILDAQGVGTIVDDDLATLAAPTNLAATAASPSQLDLTWQDNSADETEFHVERSPDGSTGWTEISTVTGAAESDTGLACGTVLHYRVRGHRHGDSQFSAYSNTADATTQACPPDPPSILTATAVSASQIDLTWSDNSADDTEFHVERSPDGSTDWTEISTVAGATHSDTGLSCGTAQHYRVRGHRHGDGQFSAYSNTATATPPTPCFTDDPLTPGSTTLKAVHITELRTRIDALRTGNGLTVFLWTDATLTTGVTLASAVHVTDLRTALDEVYTALTQTLPRYLDPTLTAGLPIKADHITELRAAVVALE